MTDETLWLALATLRPGGCWGASIGSHHRPQLTGALRPFRERELGDPAQMGRSLLGPWTRGQILAWHTTAASNGATEGLNLVSKKVKRVGGAGYRSFATYRLRISDPTR